MTPVVQKQLSGSAFGLDYAVPADFDVVFPSGSTALGTPPSSGSQISRWSSGVFLGERYTLRVVPDNNDLATWYPVNVSGQIGATNYFMFVEAYRRLFWERGLVVGGAIPQDDGRGLVIVRTAYTNNDPMQDAIISTSGFGELAYVGTATPNYTPVVVQPTAVPTRGRLVLTHVCPGGITVSATNRDGVACTVYPDGGSSIEVAVRADEFSFVEFRCPDPGPLDTGI